MGYKSYGHEAFSAEAPAGHYLFMCHGENTRYGFRHLCTVFLGGRVVAKAKRCYYNRTWERFTYESVLEDAITKCDKESRAVLKAIIIERIAEKSRADAEKFIADFEAAYEKSTPGIKKSAGLRTSHRNRKAGGRGALSDEGCKSLAIHKIAASKLPAGRESSGLTFRT